MPKFCLFWLALIPGAVWANLPSEIPICDIGGAWPPYIYHAQVNGQDSEEVTGFSVDYIRAILARRQLRARIELIPWRRCQTGVINGSYAMLLNASLNAERERDYLVSKPYYVVHDVYFYATARPVPTIATLSDLRKLRICGQAAYNYVNFGLRNDEVDAGAKSFPQAMEKLRAGRCDVVLGRREIAAGFRLLNGIDYTRHPDFGMGSAPWVKPANFHMLISRNTPYAEALLTIVNQGIDEMKHSGEDRLLARRHLEPSGHRAAPTAANKL